MKGIEQIGKDRYKVLIGHTLVDNKAYFIYKEMNSRNVVDYAKQILQDKPIDSHTEVRKHIKEYGRLYKKDC